MLPKDLDLIMVCSISVLRFDPGVTSVTPLFFQCYQRFQPNARESRRLALGVYVQKVLGILLQPTQVLKKDSVKEEKTL